MSTPGRASLARHRLVVGASDAGLRLDQVLAARLPEAVGRPVSRSKVRKLIVAGAVYVERRRVRIASRPLPAGTRLEVVVASDRLFGDAAERERQQPVVVRAIDVIHEDEWLIAIAKAPGIPTQPTLDGERIDLVRALKQFLRQRDGTPDPYVGLHHRLDRDTSGVIVFTRKREANAGVGELFAERRTTKIYWALTRPGPSSHKTGTPWTVESHLGPDRRARGKRRRFRSVASGGDYARTDLCVREAYVSGLLVEARPQTGRTHQVRVHLAEAGLPVWGDDTYGPGGEADAPRTMLHARSLEFVHPITGRPLLIECAPPPDFATWLDRLRAAPSA